MNNTVKETLEREIQRLEGQLDDHTRFIQQYEGWLHERTALRDYIVKCLADLRAELSDD